MAKLTLNTIGSRYGSIDALNANFDAIETALENTLSRDGTLPNNMDANLDMDSNRIINMADAINNADAVTLRQVNGIVAGASSGIIASLRENFVATAGQTVFNIASFTYNVGSNNLAVYLDGVRQYPGTSYTETDNNTITFSAGLHVGALVMVISNQSVDTANLNASAVHYNPAGTGAIATNVQAKLRQTVNRSDYDSDANFNAAVGSLPNVDGSNNFNAKVTPAGEPTQINLNSAVLTVAAGPRDAICYSSAQAVRVFRNYATMGGFRFRGQYTKGRAPTFPMPSSKVASLTTDLAGMSATTFENWYAVFACADSGASTATLKITPFLRAGVVAGSAIGLIKGGEGLTSDVTQTYAWSSTNNLAGTDLLIITENGGFSGRVTTITANSTSSITVSSIGSIATHDTFLPAPVGYDHYVYLGSFYEDTAEVRNIYDSGSLVKSKGIYTLYPDIDTGGFPTPTGIDCTGYISPLATAVVLDSSCVLSTSSTGTYAEYFDGDGSNHTLQSTYVQKDNSGNLTVLFDNIQLPFLYPQQFWYSNAGTLTATRINGQLNITGWFEP